MGIWRFRAMEAREVVRRSGWRALPAYLWAVAVNVYRGHW